MNTGAVRANLEKLQQETCLYTISWNQTMETFSFINKYILNPTLKITLNESKTQLSF